MDTAVEVLLAALGFAAGGYLAFKPESVYAAVLGGRRRGAEGPEAHRRDLDLKSISFGGFFILLITAHAVYLWVSAR